MHSLAFSMKSALHATRKKSPSSTWEGREGGNGEKSEREKEGEEVGMNKKMREKVRENEQRGQRWDKG